MLNILKFVGLLITAATGIVAFFATKRWDEDTEEPATASCGQLGGKKRRMTKAGRWSLSLLIFGFLVALGAQTAETIRTQQRQKQESVEKEAQRNAHEQEIARIERNNQEETARRLEAQSVRLAEMFFQGRDLDSQRAAFFERARLAGADVKIPERSNSFSMSNLTAEIRKALKSIPEELRTASVAKNSAEAERAATQTKAKELDKAIRPYVLQAWTLIQSVLAQAQREGLITVTNIGLIPMLPDRLVYSRHETNIGPRLERFFGTNCQQRIAFAHGDSWLISMLPGVLDSSNTTNENYYPMIRIGHPGPNAAILMTPALAILSFDPAAAEIRIKGSTAPHESDLTMKPEDRVAGALVEVLRQSVVRSH